MSSLDKLVKALEALKLTLVASSAEEKHVRKRSKVSLCLTATEHLCSSEMRSAPIFPSLLSFTIETLLQMCDDEDSDIRMMADECLNRIIRANMSTMHNTIFKIHVELHKEIKKNDKARSLRAALTRFSQLAYMIRPQKGKGYMQTLTPYLINIVKRKDESILETLATSVPRIFSALGSFASDNQIKNLLETLLENVSSDNAVVRRTSATCIVHVCISVPKSQVFLAFALSSLLDLVVPLRDETSSSMILGVLNCIRGLLPHIKYEERQSVIKGSFGMKRKHTSQAPPSLDYIVQVFELCLEWSGSSSDHNVVSTSLETLHQVLSSAPSSFVVILLSNQGLARSRIHHQHQQHQRLTNRSLSQMSLTSSVGGGDESLLFELEDAPLVNLSTWLSDQHVDRFSAARSSPADQTDRSRPGSTTPSASTLSLDSVTQEPSSHGIIEEHLSLTQSDSGLDTGTLRSWRSDLPGVGCEYEEKPISPEPPDVIDSLSLPSSPHIEKKWDIGELFDGECSAAVYTSRFLATRFLLGGSSVRVSIRCLAVSCLTQLVRLQPDLFYTSLERQQSVGETGSFHRVCDVLSLGDHSDQQLRGLIRVLCGQVLASSLQTFSCPPKLLLNSLPNMLELFLQGLRDESSVCVRHTLNSLSLFVRHLLCSELHSFSQPLLDMLVKTSSNPYWLIKVKLVEIVSDIPYIAVWYSLGDSSYQDKVISNVLIPALSDSDARVRKAAATAFIRLVENVHFASDHQEGDIMVALSTRLVERTLLADPSRCNEISSIKIGNNLSRIVFILSRTLMESTSKYSVYGCIEALSLLTCKYHVTEYPSSWQCSVNPSSTSNSICSSGLLSMVATLLTSSSLSIDLECHTSLLILAGNLFYGISQSFLRHADTVFDPSSLWPNIKDPKVCSDGKTLLQHVLRLLCMLVRMMDDGQKTSGVSPLKRRPSRAQSPPGKTPQSPFLDKEKREERNRYVGHFLAVPHCLKLYDLIKSAYNNYRVTLETDSSEKFLKLVSSVLTCLCDLLRPATITSSCSLTDEILLYLKIVFVLDSTRTVEVVNQLLKCLFVRKDVTKEVAVREVEKNKDSGIFDNLVGRPMKNLATLLDVSHHPPHPVDKEVDGIESRQQTGAITLDRTALATHIKLFEPIVIQALKEYTVTSNVELQVEVLKLLMQLVQLKVNYCLLDSEQIFFKFVLSQFDFLETGQIKSAELLIPEIFNFLAHLSNEKNHSKPVISIPRVIQLCDGLMASGQDPLTHCIPALTPLVEHVFVSPSPTCDTKELDTQREVILAMLLKLAEYPQVITLLQGVMKSGSWQTDQWKKLYTQTVDTLVSAMSRASIRLDRVQTVFSLLNCVSLPHLPHILTLLFTPQAEGQCTGEWVGGLAAVLMSLATSKEESVLLQLDQMNLYIQEEGDDPLNVNTKSKQLQSQQLLAKLLLKVLRNVSNEMALLETSGGMSSCNPELLFTHFSDFIYTLIHMVGPGNFDEVSKCLMHLMKSSIEVEEITENLIAIHRDNPLPLILWCHLLAELDIGNKEIWQSIIDSSIPSQICIAELSEGKNKKISIHSELVRRTGIILYCQYISVNETEEKGENLDWLLSCYTEDVILNCYEPPVEQMLRCIYMSQDHSKLLLDHLSKCIVLNQAGFTYRLLHCLEFINPYHTGLVLKLVALSLIQHSNISIARLAVSFCSRTLEYLLTLDPDQVSQQCSKEQIIALIDLFSSNYKLSKRGSVVTSLLNKLGHQLYEISVEEILESNVKSIDIALIQSTKLDSAWLAALVRDKCCKRDEGVEGRQCAVLLSKLTSDEITDILNSYDFNLNILQHCFTTSVCMSTSSLHLDATSSHEMSEEKSEECRKFPDLYKIARDILFSQLTTLQNQREEWSVTERERRVLLLSGAVSNYLSALIDNKVAFISNSVLPSGSHQLFYSFALLSTQVLNDYLSERSGSSKLLNRPTVVSSLLECISVIFNFPGVTSLLEYHDISCICDALFSAIKSLTHIDVPLKTLKSSSDNCCDEDAAFYETCLKMTSLTSWVEDSPQSVSLIPSSMYYSIRKVILRLSVSSKVLYYCRVPVEAWPVPLKCGSLPPPIDINILHDLPLLRNLTNRIAMLRWRSRQEFEETWVCLLSALIPSLDPASDELDDLFNINQLNSLVVDSVSWLVLTTLRLGSDNQSYLHVPRLSSKPVRSHSQWDRLKELNDLMISKFEMICHRLPLHLIRVDLRPNLERFDQSDYGVGQLSIEYLQYQILPDEDRSETPKSDIEMVYSAREKELVNSGLDVRSCVQFLLDLFSQWSLPNSGTTESVDLTIIRSTLCLSDLFSEKAHYVWMLEKFLQLCKNHPQFDHVIHQYLTVGVCKAAAVLSIQEEEQCERVLKVLESSLRSTFPPLRTAGVHGLLYLLQVVHPAQNACGESGAVIGNIGEVSNDAPLISHVQTSSPLDYTNKIISLAIEHINKYFLLSLESEEEDCLTVLGLVMYLVECLPDSSYDMLAVIKTLTQMIKSPPSQRLYHAAVQGVERLMLIVVRPDISDSLSRLALERLSHSDPLITLPALQLLLASLYSDVNKTKDNSPDKMSWTMEKMETTSVLFDRIKKGYLIEVELIVEIVAKVLADLFPASDILTKVIGEFLSPNQPHKRHMARIVLQCFSQACDEDQLVLLQDWVVHFLNNISSNLPTAAWCLCCFFISASTNPHLKAIFPLVQSRITQCDIEDRHILCLAALDFYRQLSLKQQEMFLATIRETAQHQKGPFSDIVACL